MTMNYAIQQLTLACQKHSCIGFVENESNPKQVYLFLKDVENYAHFTLKRLPEKELTK